MTAFFVSPEAATLLGIVLIVAIPFILLGGLFKSAKEKKSVYGHNEIKLRNQEDQTGTFQAYFVTKDIRKERYSALVGLKREWPIINEKVKARSIKELEDKIDQAYLRLADRWKEYQMSQS